MYLSAPSHTHDIVIVNASDASDKQINIHTNIHAYVHACM